MTADLDPVTYGSVGGTSGEGPCVVPAPQAGDMLDRRPAELDDRPAGLDRVRPGTAPRRRMEREWTAIWSEQLDARINPVSYTHLTLPTNREV